MKTKVIVVFGGVYSSLGKGIVVSSIGNILSQIGYKVAMLKCDPYLNVDPGTLSPYQHGEVFVTYDGAETDLDLGNYERFTNQKMDSLSNVTSGQIYIEIIKKERKGGFEGKTVQVIPHVTDAIKRKIYHIFETKQPDFLIIEVGGTVGDIESIPFIEALSQFHNEYGHENVLFTLCTPIIQVWGSSEFKTKPTQHAYRELCSLGVIPSFLFLRTNNDLKENSINKIAHNCHISAKNIFLSPNVQSIYMLPEVLFKQKLHEAILDYFKLEHKAHQGLIVWKQFTDKINAYDQTVKIALVGKYTELKDAYASLVEGLNFAGQENKAKVEIKWISADTVTKDNVDKYLSDVQGILVPGGFGIRGVEGKMLAIQYAREHLIPYFGICLGMQLATIEFAKNVVGLDDCHSTEFFPNAKHKLFDYIDGRMRLGEQECEIVDLNSKTYELHQEKIIHERHRHRFEFNNQYLKQFEEKGLSFTAFSKDEARTVEIIENKNHPFFIAVQYHPELACWPNKPNKLIQGFIASAMKIKR